MREQRCSPRCAGTAGAECQHAHLTRPNVLVTFANTGPSVAYVAPDPPFIVQPAMTEEPRVRIVFPQGEDDTISGVTIFVNAAGQLELLRALATLHPGNRHVHLERLLTPAGSDEAAWADVVFTEGRGDVAHAPPTN